MSSNLLADWVAAGLDPARLPTHVAIIMDGNGRWATERGKDRLFGHAEGYAALERVVDWCGKIGLKYLTVYGFSSENWRRPQSEVGGLMELIERAMLEQIERLKRANVRVNVIGRLDELPESLRNTLRSGVQETESCTGLSFTLAINYGGRAEILDAIRTLAIDGGNLAEVREEDILKSLYMPEMPETDLMIRTAGEMRWSNFLLWQSAYAELYVTDATWPAFDENELLKALLEYQKRTRKFGAIAQ